MAFVVGEQTSGIQSRSLRTETGNLKIRDDEEVDVLHSAGCTGLVGRQAANLYHCATVACPVMIIYNVYLLPIGYRTGDTDTLTWITLPRLKNLLDFLFHPFSVKDCVQVY